MPRVDAALCPCGSAEPYAACCARWHAGALHLQAPTALLLMRSRYSAYAMGLHDYLMATWHPETRPASIQADAPGWRWLGLEIKASTIPDADHATVEFVARSKIGGRAHRLRETSRFERLAGRWFYIDGDTG